MNDSNWLEHIRKARKYLRKHQLHKKRAEDEYFKRFGVHPSDCDDDYWLDTIRLQDGGDPEHLDEVDLDQLKAGPKLYNRGR